MKVGMHRIYNESYANLQDVVMWDVLEIDRVQRLKIKFISKNSKNRQGIRLAIDVGDGHLEVNGVSGRAFVLWEDTAPKEFICNCFANEGQLSVYNVWDKGIGLQSQLLTSGMLIKQEGDISTYLCNDYGYTTNFDKLVFSIEKI